MAFLLLAEAVELFLELPHARDGALFAAPALPQIGRLAAQALEVVLDVAQAFPRGGVLFLTESLALDLQVGSPPVEVVDLDGHGANLQAQGGAGLIDQVDGLIGQEAVGNVALREQGGGENGGILDAHAVVDLKFLFETAQNGDGVFDSGLADRHSPEAACQRGILLDVLLVFIQGGGADATQLTAGEQASAGWRHRSRLRLTPLRPTCEVHR